ncbi:hypothetical protein HDU86_001700 [Geranomyces michiganensis]|nr:hypothetical protein HDU86_001700 [Geranomyces michiganensis]
MEVIQSTGKSLADKETAFDELEMLVKSFYNANELLTAIASTDPQALSAGFKARIKDELIPSVKHAMSDDEPVVSSEVLQRLEAALLL